MKVLILSGYNAQSHEWLNRGLISYLSEMDFTLLALPPRYFAWRTRGNSLSFAFENRAELTAGYDRIFATSMTDITGLRGLVPELSHMPLTVYFHENQFDYPESRSGHSNLEAKLVSIYNALAADNVVFNTAYNMETFLAGAESLLRKMPDHVPSGLTDIIRQKSSVLSVPIAKMDKKNGRNDVPVILWNHRWEYDKGPDGFLLVLNELADRGYNFRLNILGQSFRQIPDSFRVIKERFSERILNWGYADTREDYKRIVSESDVVISTSLHDFQGLSVMEAADGGCIPVLPERLSYPELFGPEYLYMPDDEPHKEASNCADAVMTALQKSAPDMGRFHWENLINSYRKLFI